MLAQVISSGVLLILTFWCSCEEKNLQLDKQESPVYKHIQISPRVFNIRQNGIKIPSVQWFWKPYDFQEGVLRIKFALLHATTFVSVIFLSINMQRVTNKTKRRRTVRRSSCIQSPWHCPTLTTLGVCWQLSAELNQHENPWNIKRRI
jgi:hypothetical protein